MQRYERVKKIGKGSYGEAVLARRKGDGMCCVIKSIAVDRLSRREAKLVRQEAKLLATLRHPHIVSHVETFFDKHTVFIVMEHCDGGDLEQWTRRRRRGRRAPEVEVMSLFAQLCMALEHVHARRVVHRDVKTSNAFLCGADVLKLGDFGVSRVLRPRELAATSIGSPAYMSPELLEELPYDYKVDVWSAGCVLYEIATLKRAFAATSVAALARKVGKGAVDLDAASPDVRDIVADMLRRDPSQRPDVSDILKRPAVARAANRVRPAAPAKEQLLFSSPEASEADLDLDRAAKRERHQEPQPQPRGEPGPHSGERRGEPRCVVVEEGRRQSRRGPRQQSSSSGGKGRDKKSPHRAASSSSSPSESPSPSSPALDASDDDFEEPPPRTPKARADYRALGDGWWLKRDAASGRWFYVHEATGHSQWEPPSPDAARRQEAIANLASFGALPDVPDDEHDKEAQARRVRDAVRARVVAARNERKGVTTTRHQREEDPPPPLQEEEEEEEEEDDAEENAPPKAKGPAGAAGGGAAGGGVVEEGTSCDDDDDGGDALRPCGERQSRSRLEESDDAGKRLPGGDETKGGSPPSREESPVVRSGDEEEGRPARPADTVWLGNLEAKMCDLRHHIGNLRGRREDPPLDDEPLVDDEPLLDDEAEDSEAPAVYRCRLPLDPEEPAQEAAPPEDRRAAKRDADRAELRRRIAAGRAANKKQAESAADVVVVAGPPPPPRRDHRDKEGQRRHKKRVQSLYEYLQARSNGPTARPDDGRRATLDDLPPDKDDDLLPPDKDDDDLLPPDGDPAASPAALRVGDDDRYVHEDVDEAYDHVVELEKIERTGQVPMVEECQGTLPPPPPSPRPPPGTGIATLDDDIPPMPR